MSRDINRLVFDCRARRVLAKKVVALPVLRRSGGSGNETATTVGTDIAQHILNTGGTERTFIGTDACLMRVGWQGFVTKLAGWPEFQHDSAGNFFIFRHYLST